MKCVRPETNALSSLTDDTLDKWHRLYYVAGVLVIASIVLRQPLLFVAGLLVLLLAWVPEIWYRYGLRSMRVSHELGATRIGFGEGTELRLVVENRKPLPLPFCEIEDEVADALRVRGMKLGVSVTPERRLLRDTLALWVYQRVRRHYHIRATARGAYRFGPLTVRVGDPFGLLERAGEVSCPTTLVVHPLVAPIERFGLSAQAPFGEHQSHRRLLEDPLWFSGIRSYAPGDEPRRIHWKATARTGVLQSKMYESSTRQTLAIFVDVRTYSKLIGGYDPALAELAISAAASLAIWGDEQRYAVGVFSNGALTTVDQQSTPADVAPGEGGMAGAAGAGTSGEQADDRVAREISRAAANMTLHLLPSAHVDQPLRILDGLARLLPYYAQAMEQVIASEEQRLPLGSAVVYIGAETVITVPLILALRRLRSLGHSVTLLLTRASETDDGAEHALSLADLAVHYIGGRELWDELSGDALGSAAGRNESNNAPMPQGVHSVADHATGMDTRTGADTGMVGEAGEVEHGERRDPDAQSRKTRTRSILVE